MKVSKGTIVRTIMVILVILNIIFERCGIDVINVSESEVFMIVETVIEIAIIAVGFWKNNSYSEEAKKADEFLKQLREGDDNGN